MRVVHFSKWVLVWLGGLAACKPVQEQKQKEHDPVTLKISAHSDVVKAFETIAASTDFKQTFPYITLEVVKQGGPKEIKKRVKTCGTLGNCYDIELMGMDDVLPASVDTTSVPGQEIANLLDLGKNGVSIDNKYPTAMGWVQDAKGRSFGVPFDAGPSAIYYRLDLMTEAITRYNTDHPGTPKPTGSEAAVMAYVDQLTWDELFDDLAPYLLLSTPDATRNDGFPAFVMPTLEELTQTFMNIDAPAFADDSLKIRADWKPYLRKMADVLRRAVIGKNSRAAHSGYDPLKSYVMQGSTWPSDATDVCNLLRPDGNRIKNDDGSDRFFNYFDTYVWSEPWGCSIQFGLFALTSAQSWQADRIATGDWGFDPSTLTWARSDAFKAQYRIAPLFGVRAGGILPADIPHLHVAGYFDGSALAVPATTQHKEDAVAVLKYLTGKVSAQLQSYAITNSLPALPDVYDESFAKPDARFGNEAIGQVFASVAAAADVVPGINLTRNSTHYDGAIGSATQEAASEVFDINTADLSDANASALGDAFLAKLQQKLDAIAR